MTNVNAALDKFPEMKSLGIVDLNKVCLRHTLFRLPVCASFPSQPVIPLSFAEEHTALSSLVRYHCSLTYWHSSSVHRQWALMPSPRTSPPSCATTVSGKYQLLIIFGMMLCLHVFEWCPVRSQLCMCRFLNFHHTSYSPSTHTNEHRWWPLQPQLLLEGHGQARQHQRPL